MEEEKRRVKTSASEAMRSAPGVPHHHDPCWPANHVRCRRAADTSCKKAALLRRCLGPERSEEDWRLLHDRHGQAIRDIAGGALRAAGLEARLDKVEELCQEVYLRWWRAESGFDGRTEAAFWRFIQISVRHALCDRRRRAVAAKRRPRGPQSVCGRRDGNPYERLLREERRRAVLRHCLEAGAGLEGQRSGAESRRQAAALGWILLGGCTGAEAGRRWGVERKRIEQLMRRLRTNMSREGIPLPHRGRA